MSFLYPHLLYALILPALLAIAAWFIMRRRSRKWEILVSSVYAPELVRTSSSWKKILPLVFGILSLCFLIPSIARPYSGQKEVPEIQKSHNIIIAIDCSRSMLAKDVMPSRLDRAKTAAYDLLDDLPEDKFGLIIFSGEAQLLMPLTHDHNSLKESIEQLEFGWIASGGTNLENVVQLGLQTFSRDKTKDTSNALVILSDGEDTVNIKYNTAKKAKENKLIVVTAGIGTLHGDTIPDARQPDGIYRDKYNQQILTKLDPKPLELLASETGGQYIQLSNGKELTLHVKKIAGRLEREESVGDQRMIPNDRFSVFAIPALIFLILALLTGTKWRRFSKKHTSKSLALLLAVGFFSSSSHGAELTGEAKRLIQEEKWAEAEKNLNTLSQNSYTDQEEDSRISFAKGYIGLKNAKEQEAKRNFSKALLSSDKNVQAAAHYNLGNTVAQEAFNILSPKKAEGAPPASAVEAAGNPNPSPNSPQLSDEQVKKAKQLISNAIDHYNDTLETNKNYQAAVNNKKKLEDYLKEIENEQKRREEEKKQEQDKKQDQNQQDQNQQDKGDQNKQDQNQQDKGDQNKQDQNQQDKGDQNKQDQNQQDKGDQNKQDQNQQDKGDQNKQDQNQQDKGDQNKQDQNQQDKGDQNKQDQKQQDKGDQNKQDQNQQDKGDQNKQDQNQQDKGDQGQQDQSSRNPQPGNEQQSNPNLKAVAGQENKADASQKSSQQNQQLQAAEVAESKEESDKKEAARMLRERMDAEKGSPIPQAPIHFIPEKDY